VKLDAGSTFKKSPMDDHFESETFDTVYKNCRDRIIDINKNFFALLNDEKMDKTGLKDLQESYQN